MVHCWLPLPAILSVKSCWQFEIGLGSIYTIEIGKCYKSSFSLTSPLPQAVCKQLYLWVENSKNMVVIEFGVRGGGLEQIMWFRKISKWVKSYKWILCILTTGAYLLQIPSPETLGGSSLPPLLETRVHTTHSQSAPKYACGAFWMEQDQKRHEGRGSVPFSSPRTPSQSQHLPQFLWLPMPCGGKAMHKGWWENQELLLLSTWIYSGARKAVSRGHSSPANIWQCLQTFSFVTTGGRGCYWHLMGRSC